jgi:hypothetical protein
MKDAVCRTRLNSDMLSSRYPVARSNMTRRRFSLSIWRNFLQADFLGVLGVLRLPEDVARCRSRFLPVASVEDSARMPTKRHLV